VIEIKALSKTYQQAGSAIHAINNVDISIDKGQTVAITGRSGSGKTTLLTLLAGLDRPTHGEISILGKNLTSMSEKEMGQFRGENIGIVFQKFHLMPYLTAQENVSLPLEILGIKNADEKASESLALVGLEDRLTHLPAQLSGGECQRVAIARALITSPAILLADEPSGNLDSHTGQIVMDLLFELAEKKKSTLILVTHDQTLASRCQRQISLVAGSITH
jgi:putative ABC transport system ATP-binding protein